MEHAWRSHAGVHGEFADGDKDEVARGGTEAERCLTASRLGSERSTPQTICANTSTSDPPLSAAFG